jgi:hypothetical protein
MHGSMKLHQDIWIEGQLRLFTVVLDVLTYKVMHIRWTSGQMDGDELRRDDWTDGRTFLTDNLYDMRAVSDGAMLHGLR